MGTLWAELALLEAGYEGELLEALAAGESIGAVAFDPGYVVNGDIADVVLTVQGETVCRAGQVTASALSTLDPTRRLASIAVGATEPVGPAPGLIDKAGLLLAAEQVGAAARALDLTVEYTKTRVHLTRHRKLPGPQAPDGRPVRAGRIRTRHRVSGHPRSDTGECDRGENQSQRSTLGGIWRFHPTTRRHRHHLGT